ncbi:hypothetical protein ACWF94_31640 [Streptomyces sp. NPDC055078]
MTPGSLTTDPPPVLTAHCIGCQRRTTAPVPVRCTQHPETTLYACPRCATTLTPGPTPDELTPDT